MLRGEQFTIYYSRNCRWNLSWTQGLVGLATELKFNEPWSQRAFSLNKQGRPRGRIHKRHKLTWDHTEEIPTAETGVKSRLPETHFIFWVTVPQDLAVFGIDSVQGYSFQVKLWCLVLLSDKMCCRDQMYTVCQFNLLLHNRTGTSVSQLLYSKILHLKIFSTNAIITLIRSYQDFQWYLFWNHGVWQSLKEKSRVQKLKVTNFPSQKLSKNKDCFTMGGKKP